MVWQPAASSICFSSPFDGSFSQSLIYCDRHNLQQRLFLKKKQVHTQTQTIQCMADSDALGASPALIPASSWPRPASQRRTLSRRQGPPASLSSWPCCPWLEYGQEEQLSKAAKGARRTAGRMSQRTLSRGRDVARDVLAGRGRALVIKARALEEERA